MTLLWKVLILCLVCLLLGGLPLVSWITRSLSGKQLAQVGTGNMSVSAAFYHGGRLAGILAVLSEAAKGILAVFLARAGFPHEPVWEIIALIALVLGRFGLGRGAGTTNVTWGFVVHDWAIAVWVGWLSGVYFFLTRRRQQSRLFVLGLLPMVSAWRHPRDLATVGATAILSGLMAWIYQQMPDDLDLATAKTSTTNRSVLRYLQGHSIIPTLDRPLATARFGQKAATLSQLKAWGYPVPAGWVLSTPKQSQPLLKTLTPSPEQPLIVRSSAVGEDSLEASAAGQYVSILDITSRPELARAIADCLASYQRVGARQYRQDRNLGKNQMAILVQQQVSGQFSGVVFSRDPVTRQSAGVAIEALPGDATQVVSGHITPEQYRVYVEERDWSQIAPAQLADLNDEQIQAIACQIEGRGQVPSALIQQVAIVARHLEARFHGVPQDIEWTYDGETLWVLQSRPITTLLPIWTRKIAAEVIPGAIRPLTWSINQPLTCGVWGQLFTFVLGKRGQDLDFSQTAELHNAHAYFNASLLGEIFRRMGLPPESLEFLTRGAKFRKPPLTSTLRNLPGLWRLLQREFSLIEDFQRLDRQYFTPAFAQVEQEHLDTLTDMQLLARVDTLLALLETVTYFSILAPLSLSLRQAVLHVPEAALDYQQLPEVAAMRSLQQLATQAQAALQSSDVQPSSSQDIRDALSQSDAGQAILVQFEQFLDQYGYLSDVGTDIAIATWQESPQPVYELFANLIAHPTPTPPSKVAGQGWKVENVQQRVDLKGRVTAVYSRLLAEVRWSFVALEQQWLKSEQLTTLGDIFFLTLSEIRQQVAGNNQVSSAVIRGWVKERRSHHEQMQQLSHVPQLIYNAPPDVSEAENGQEILENSAKMLRGIGASPGLVEGPIKILLNAQMVDDFPSDTILVVPYTDSGWVPLLARASGIISDVGGRLSHGAIVAREYHIPAVMDITNATQRLQDGQRVRLDGQKGTVELL